MMSVRDIFFVPFFDCDRAIIGKWRVSRWKIETCSRARADPFLSLPRPRPRPPTLVEVEDD